MKSFLVRRTSFKSFLRLLVILLFPLSSYSQINDLCLNATPLTPTTSLTCTGIGGSITVATTYNAISNNCTTRPDVWYSFTAGGTSAYIALTVANMNTRFQVYPAGACVGTPASVFCSAGLTGLATGLTSGAGYLIRVYNNAGTATTFNICVTNPPANDLCANAVNVTTAPTCAVATPVLLNLATTYVANGVTDACNTSTDVWYTFTAQSTATTINLTGAPGNTRIQVMTGACGAFTNVNCGGTSPLALTGLTIGTVYRVRIYNTSGTTGSFTMCITDNHPADNCSGTVPLLTSDFTCINTAANMYASTLTASTNTPCTGTPVYDIWFRFVAQAINHTVTLSSLGSHLTGAGMNMQLITTCGATPTSIACGNGLTMDAANLTPGTTYFIRVYTTSGTAPAVPTNSGFNICVTHEPPPAPPSNDECAGAVTLQNGSGCGNIQGNVLSATASSVPIAPCTGPVSYDVWYKFVAAVTNPTITLSGGANNFTSRALQLFSGTCGSLTSLFCGTTSIAATGLIVGNTYYIRVYSNSGLAAPTGNAQFSICVQSPGLQPKFGNSYVNLSKKTAGGVIQNGDTLEIRMTISLPNGTLTNVRFLDSVPKNTVMLSGPNDSIRVITNEGITYQRFTPAADADRATYILNPPTGQYQIRMNMALSGTAPAFPPDNTTTETASTAGQIVNGDLPKSGGSSTLFGTSFRVRVTGALNDTVVLGMAKFIYRTAATGTTDLVLTATPYKILITNPLSLCVNATGVNMSNEFGGTFGSGTTLNRPTDLTSPIAGYTFVNTSVLQGLGDGQYSIVKNISPRSGTNRTAERVNSGCPITLPSQLACGQRMHGGHWDVDGDHTGTNNSVGNIPLAEGANGGYMLMVNADFVASETYRQTIKGLCPNTYYEFSAWIRNICPTCGVDFNTGANPATPNQVPGVAPNLTFALDGLDRYNTGEVSHATGWSKRGFVFITGNNQDSATFTIRNNSQGGGGNDWVMDDISVATCLPNMSYSPTLNPTVCSGNSFTLRDTIRSFFSNYRHHQWQRSTDGGATWTDLGIARDSTPVLVGGAWQYVTTYTIPPSMTNSTHDNDLYRVLVATTNPNLSNANCRVTDGVSFIRLDVDSCGIPLSTDLLSFTGRLVSDRASLSWTTSKEDEPIQFNVERSNDGQNFYTIGTVNSYNNYTAASNTYSFTDPVPVLGKKYYRITLNNRDNKKKYSRTIQLNKDATELTLVNLINPFANKLEFDIDMPLDGKVEVVLTDMFGKPVRKTSYIVTEGINSLNIPNTGALAAGIYILQINTKDKSITRKVVKKTI
jgi:hypothetical protein